MTSQKHFQVQTVLTYVLLHVQKQRWDSSILLSKLHRHSVPASPPCQFVTLQRLPEYIVWCGPTKRFPPPHLPDRWFTAAQAAEVAASDFAKETMPDRFVTSRHTCSKQTGPGIGIKALYTPVTLPYWYRAFAGGKYCSRLLSACPPRPNPARRSQERHLSPSCLW